VSSYKPANNRAWLGVLPVVLIVAFSAVIPLMTVVNYSVQDILDFNTRFFVGFDWYRETLTDPRFQSAFLRQVGFSLTVLLIEVPLGIAIARGIPRGSRLTPLILILLAMDVWHWTSLVALLAFAGLTAIPKAFYQAAELDGAGKWQTFRLVELPRLRGVLIIAVLLRLMDSFMIYTEPFVLTGGGPGNATTFLSQYLATMAVGQFDLGPAAAFSVIYFLFILLFCWLFYTSVVRRGEE
jgi:glycerol transport system permease protein